MNRDERAYRLSNILETIFRQPFGGRSYSNQQNDSPMMVTGVTKTISNASLIKNRIEKRNFIWKISRAIIITSYIRWFMYSA